VKEKLKSKLISAWQEGCICGCSMVLCPVDMGAAPRLINQLCHAHIAQIRAVIDIYREYPENRQYLDIPAESGRGSGKWPAISCGMKFKLGKIFFSIQASIEFRYLPLFKIIFTPY